jgi:hypothetical protein
VSVDEALDRIDETLPRDCSTQAGVGHAPASVGRIQAIVGLGHGLVRRELRPGRSRRPSVDQILADAQGVRTTVDAEQDMVDCIQVIVNETLAHANVTRAISHLVLVTSRPALTTSRPKIFSVAQPRSWHTLCVPARYPAAGRETRWNFLLYAV